MRVQGVDRRKAACGSRTGHAIVRRSYDFCDCDKSQYMYKRVDRRRSFVALQTTGGGVVIATIHSLCASRRVDGAEL